MRPTRFRPETLVALLRRQRVATIVELKAALGTRSEMTVFRKLRAVDYLTSYSHRGRFYALRESTEFDERGLWSYRGIHFSRFGTLLDTATEVVSRSEQGYYAPELVKELEVPVKDALFRLVERRRLTREELAGMYLYLAAEAEKRRHQRLHREAALASRSQLLPGVAEVETPDEVRAAILLFYSLLDEQQRRLFAGLESLRLGRGGDRRIAESLKLDAHTVGRGRKELVTWDLQMDRVRRPGGGRPPVEKKRPK
jgi:hypothetical protein